MTNTQIAALQILLKLAQTDRPAELSCLASQLGLSCVDTDELLMELERAGLVDADRVRLTMAGLTVAVASPSRPRRKPKRCRTAA